MTERIHFYDPYEQGTACGLSLSGRKITRLLGKEERVAIEIDDLDLRKALLESADRRRKAIENNRKGDAEYWKGYEQALWDAQHNDLVGSDSIVHRGPGPVA